MKHFCNLKKIPKPAEIGIENRQFIFMTKLSGRVEKIGYRILAQFRTQVFHVPFRDVPGPTASWSSIPIPTPSLGPIAHETPAPLVRPQIRIGLSFSGHFPEFFVRNSSSSHL